MFVYGFAKSEKSNIDQDELMFWRSLAGAFLAMDEAKTQESITADVMSELMCDDKPEAK